LIMRLDDTSTSSSLGEQQARARALRVRIARLQQERDGRVEDRFQCPADIQASVPELCANEESLLEARRRNFANKRNVLEARLEQKIEELAEARSNIARHTENLAVIDKEA